MKYFSPAEVFFAVTAFALYGALCGVLYPMLSRIGAMLRALFCLPTDALALARAPARRKADGCARRRMQPYGGAGKHLGDFFFFLAVGIGLLLLTYVTLDGMYRLYTLLAFLSCCLSVAILSGSIFRLFWIVYALSCTARCFFCSVS